MIDIHSHLLYGVDDGAKTRKESIQMLKEAKKQNVKAMILTPHYRKEMFKHSNEIIEEHFRDLKAAADEIGIDIYLGTEFHIHSKAVEYLQKGRCRTLADTEYVLVRAPMKYEVHVLGDGRILFRRFDGEEVVALLEINGASMIDLDSGEGLIMIEPIGNGKFVCR